MPFSGTEYINMVALRGKILNDSPVSSSGKKGSWRKEYLSGTKLLAMYSQPCWVESTPDSLHLSNCFKEMHRQ